MVRRLLLVAIALFPGGCGAPRDPDGATARILAERVIRVGVTDNPPGVRLGEGEPRGLEADLVRRFAATLGARVEWTAGSESVIAEKLKSRELDLVAAGLESRTQWSKEIAVSQVYLRDPGGKKHVLLAAPGENQLLLRLDTFLAEAKPVLETGKRAG